ncbi:MAG TPA: alpha/beta hydrolase-fold protein [Vicinamibacterales bacterium]|nr:alpha/beta hydrolase-fold protein [Vicinamibacterales bacterium]
MTFRVLAPQAAAVSVGGDINGSLVPDPNPPAPAPAADSAPGAGRGGGRGGTPVVTMTKGENGVWSGTTLRAVRPGAWRYTYSLDGAPAVDIRNTRTSPNQTQVQSLLVVPGDFSETRDVPHGAVASVHYVATALSHTPREMFVYTPPGYEKGSGTYPVLYLIHGGGDTAVSWSTVGRANDIVDNLIAEKKALPMIVVMPSGWTPSGGQVMTADATKDPFNAEMLTDIIPYVESHYRTRGTPETRALSGLSMGGIQTLNVGLHNLGTFRYLAVMSSGWTTEQDRDWFYTHEAAKIPSYNKELKLFWWGWGETDIARANGLAVIDTFKKQGVRIETMETPGGHEWPNWRLYLHEVAPKLFR